MISGLFLTKQDEKPILIKIGTYSSPVVIPNTDWVVCAKADKGWVYPNNVVKIDLNTFEETVIDLPPADTMDPVVFINDKLLIIREGIGYYYDVSSDTLTEIQGDFNCFSHPVRAGYGFTGRFWQKTSEPDKYYALANQYTIGIFDIKTLKFTELMKSDVFIYDYTQMWVDEEKDAIYAVVNNDLIEFPLKIN